MPIASGYLMRIRHNKKTSCPQSLDVKQSLDVNDTASSSEAKIPSKDHLIFTYSYIEKDIRTHN